MPNYANGKVYKICSYNSDDVYYGSTCLSLCQRLANSRPPELGSERFLAQYADLHEGKGGISFDYVF
jgi:hypothetical protein